MDIFMTILIGAISSLIASLVFFRLLRLIIPKIQISPNITKSYTEAGKRIYSIKIINQGKRTAVNIEAELHLIYMSSLSNGPVLTTKELTLKRSRIFTLNQYNKKKKKDDYSFKFLTYDDVEEMIKDKTREYQIRISIMVHDELSGLGKVFTKIYDLNEILEGRFQSGYSFKIVKDELNPKNT